MTDPNPGDAAGTGDIADSEDLDNFEDFESDDVDDVDDDDDDDDDGMDDEEDEEDDKQGVELRIDKIDDPIEHLLQGEIEVEGRMPYSSNATFLVHVTHNGKSHPAIYKPMRGERPLWDFEPGLHRREVAAYRMSEALGAHDVPRAAGGRNPGTGYGKGDTAQHKGQFRPKAANIAEKPGEA